jgi:hypothetical protein
MNPGTKKGKSGLSFGNADDSDKAVEECLGPDPRQGQESHGPGPGEQRSMSRETELPSKLGHGCVG